MTKLENIAIEEVAKILKDETFDYNGAECVVVSDAERCYIQGYKDAIDRACEYIKLYAPIDYDSDGFVDVFRESMIVE